MDSDPAWVQEKHYSEVQLEGGVWMRQPLSYAALQRCSILLDAMEARVFEQSQDFLEAVYQVSFGAKRRMQKRSNGKGLQAAEALSQCRATLVQKTDSCCGVELSAC